MGRCDRCEELMQPYLDRALTPDEHVTVERHLDDCAWCRKRFRFEEELRMYVRVACTEPMAPELKERLAALRTPLV